MIAESPLPALAMECRLTKAAFPRAMAYPSAMPAADRSCSPRTYRKSEGMSRRKGNSVEPGEAYAAFRGRAATVEPMLRKKGLIEA